LTFVYLIEIQHLRSQNEMIAPALFLRFPQTTSLKVLLTRVLQS
jgi:hypothetical protein